MIMFIVELLQHSAVLSVITVGFASDFVKTDNGRICEGRSELCYFEVTKETKNWVEATDLCKMENANLPAILNEMEQNEFQNLMRRFVTGNEEVWTAGKQYSYGEFTWLNGRPISRSERIEVPHYLNTQVTLTSNLLFRAADPRNSNYYICQFSGDLCNSNELFKLASGCLNKSDEQLPWYDARNKCLDAGGDLAVLENENLTILRDWLIRDRSYSIGLRSLSFRWFSSGTADNNDEIKYTNFRLQHNSPISSNDGCISIRFSDGQWNDVNCRTQKRVLCQRRLVPTRSETPSHSDQSTSTSTSNPATGNGSPQGDESNPGTGPIDFTIHVAVVAVAIVIVICIIIIVVVLMKRRGKSPRREDKPHRGTDAEQDRQNTTKGHMIDRPNYNEEQTATDNQCHYAEIPAKPVSGPEASESNPRPDIVYATMDFQNEPAYDEAKSTSVNLNVGQHGDQALYAVPYAENGGKQRGNTMSDQPTYGNVVKTKVGH